MNLNESFPVSPAKVEELKDRIRRLGIDPAKIEERFVRGSGKGGQKINKTSNCVQLRYPPLDLTVRCQEDRQRSVNRFLALRELVDRVEMQVSPETSKRLREIEKVRRRKAKRSQRSEKKYGGAPARAGGEEGDMATTQQNLKIDVRKISEEHARELGIPEKPESTGTWSPWECEPKTFDWEYTSTETAYFYEGRARVRTPAEEVEIGPGDLVMFPEGLKCTWTVLQKVRKVYSYEEG